MGGRQNHLEFIPPPPYSGQDEFSSYWKLKSSLLRNFAAMHFTVKAESS
jgi:hypothetical protein